MSFVFNLLLNRWMNKLTLVILLALVAMGINMAHKACTVSESITDKHTRDYVCLHDCWTRGNIDSCVGYRAYDTSDFLLPGRCYNASTMCYDYDSCDMFCTNYNYEITTGPQNHCFWDLQAEPESPPSCKLNPPSECTCDDFSSCRVHFC